MIKSVLNHIFILVLILTTAAIGYVTIKPVLDTLPVIMIDNACEIYDGVAYIKILDNISVEDSAGFWSEMRGLKAFGVSQVQIYINNYGGYLFDGFALHDSIRSLSAGGVFIEGYGDGVVASAAVIVFAACDHRTASKNCVFMVHNPKARAHDNDPLAKVFRLQYAEMLASCSGLSAEEWLEKMAGDGTWFSAEEALEWGLVDEIR